MGACGAQVHSQVACTAEGLKWLWALRGVIERVMVAQCKMVAETFVAFAARVSREGLDVVRAPAGLGGSLRTEGSHVST